MPQPAHLPARSLHAAVRHVARSQAPCSSTTASTHGVCAASHHAQRTASKHTARPNAWYVASQTRHTWAPASDPPRTGILASAVHPAAAALLAKLHAAGGAEPAPVCQPRCAGPATLTLSLAGWLTWARAVCKMLVRSQVCSSWSSKGCWLGACLCNKHLRGPYCSLP